MQTALSGQRRFESPRPGRSLAALAPPSPPVPRLWLEFRLEPEEMGRVGRWIQDQVQATGVFPAPEAEALAGAFLGMLRLLQEEATGASPFRLDFEYRDETVGLRLRAADRKGAAATHHLLLFRRPQTKLCSAA